jgi:hypothetical protein
VLKALAKRPEDRYASAAALADDLRRHLDGRPVLARRQTVAYRARRLVRRHRARMAVAAVATLVAGASLGAAAMARASVRREARLGVLEATLRAAASGARAPDAAAMRALAARALAAARTPGLDPTRRARLLDGAGELQARLGAHQAAFALLQEALVVRRRLDGEPPPPPRAAPAPGARALLFTRPGGIFAVDEDGSHERRIADDVPAWSASPTWAPDGRRVLLTRLTGRARAVFVIGIDGSGLTQITAPPAGWSDDIAVPLGNRVAFRRSGPDGAARIYAVRLDGTGLAPLTAGPNDHDVAPGPGGAFFVYRRGNDVYRRDGGGGERRLTFAPDRYTAGLAVSPDGRRIAFTRIDPGRLEQVFVMDSDGAHVRRVSRGDHYDFLPRWSPDGTRLAFTSRRDGSLGVYTMRLDGSDVRDVSRTPGSLVERPDRNVLEVTETLWAWAQY